jgi:hypothetical protein
MLSRAQAPASVRAALVEHWPWIADTLFHPATVRPRRSWPDPPRDEVLQQLPGTLKAATKEQRKAAAAYYLAKQRSSPEQDVVQWGTAGEATLTYLARVRLDWSVEEIGWLLTCLPDGVGPLGVRNPLLVRVPLAAAERLRATDRASFCLS